MIETPSSSLEIRNNKGQADGKLFDTYYTIHVQESIGTLFLGILVILLFLELKRSRNHS